MHAVIDYINSTVMIIDHVIVLCTERSIHLHVLITTITSATLTHVKSIDHLNSSTIHIAVLLIILSHAHSPFSVPPDCAIAASLGAAVCDSLLLSK